MFNLIYANVFFEHESHESDESFRLRPGMYSWNSGDYFPLVSGSSTNLVVKNQPQAGTLANPFIIPLHQKKQRSKKIRVKDSVCIRAIREPFFDLRSVAAGSQNELQQGFSLLVYFL